ncbi:unnamed protein product, partial [marine sediment metagenome]
TGSLKRRGMKPIILSDWEVHGPNPAMDYQVFVGEALKDGSDDIWLVAIYPRAVYWIEHPSEWREIKSENKIWQLSGPVFFQSSPDCQSLPLWP